MEALSVEAPTVHTPGGAVSGAQLGAAQFAYLGIPYAQPPVGKLRFALPVKREPWQGVRDGSHYGATPLRDYMASNETAIPEPSYPGDDTLLVNVFTPSPGDADAALPVYVWIHGGGFVTGSPSSTWYEQGAFPRDGVVVVSVSYRLGFDGFGVVDGAPDNRAVHDWILALEWVRESIAAFGGDPERVTIGGQSAGGAAVLTLLTAPSAQDLFRAVIAESPAMITGSRDLAAERTKKLAAALGIEPTREAFARVDEEALFAAQDKLGRDEVGIPFIRGLTRGTTPAMGWTPVVDGHLIPYPVEEAVARGIGSDKPLLIGATANEVDRLSESLPRAFDFVPQTLALRTVGFTADSARAYAAATPGRTRETLGRVSTDGAFRFYVARVLAARSAYAAEPSDATGEARAVAGTFAYDFRMPSATTGLAGHCIELPFAWDCITGERVVERNTGPNPPQSLADATHAAWVSFIAGSAPSGAGSGSSATGGDGLVWPAWDAQARRGIILDREPRTDEVFAREVALAHT